MLRLESRLVKFEFRTRPAAPRWDDHGMGTYRQYCPIARASEILAER